ncbi:hypothetical protein BH24ACT2_BH24ACT2_10470 [soil metagenome]
MPARTPACGDAVEHVEVLGLQVAYRRAGEGPLLVLLHGGLCDSRVWRVQLEELSDEYTVVAWDAPGCRGSSDRPIARAPLETNGRVAAQRCSGLGKSKRHPASHSERWLPWAGMPPPALSIRARCRRFQVMKVVLRLVKSFSGPPEPGSR